MGYKPNLESLEGRLTPAGTINLVGGLLVVQADNGPNAVDVRTDGQGNVTVRVDDLVRTFSTARITAASISTNDGDDDVFTNLAVPTTVSLGRGNDNGNILHGAGTFLDGGDGRDQLYAIIGPNVVNGGRGPDRIITNAASTFDRDRADETPIVFGQTVNQGFTQIGNVVYYVPGNGDNQVLLTRSGNRLLAFSSVNGVAQPLATFNLGTVDSFATVMGPGNDTVINQVDGLRLIIYGAGGNDVVVTGRARLAFVKGGSGNDTIDASQARESDITGDQGVDVLSGNVVRTDGLDVIRLTGRNPKLVNAA